MDDILQSSNEFDRIKKQYNTMLLEFLSDDSLSEHLLKKGYEFGRESIKNNFGIISVVAIHHDCLVGYLEELKSDNHLDMANKASILLEEVLSTFKMVANGFNEAINLLNKRSIEFAVRIRALQYSLKEKDVLLKEVYHRVKNNLQVISSLINLQIGATPELSTKAVLIDSSTRVKAMALIHEMLYQSENLSKIEISSYVKKLFNNLTNIHNADTKRIKFNFDVNTAYLSIDKAIPCGLIINELISNSFKHAFPDNMDGEINFILDMQGNMLKLAVSDNGIGINENINIQHTHSLGMKLIYNLTEQLGGTIALEKSKGTTFILTFMV